MENYQSKVNYLRTEIVRSIINLLKEHGLKELELDDDNGNAHDSPVRKVSLDKNGICLDVEDEDTGFTATLYSHDLGCQNLDWLCKLHENMLDTFEEPINDE